MVSEYIINFHYGNAECFVYALFKNNIEHDALLILQNTKCTLQFFCVHHCSWWVRAVHCRGVFGKSGRSEWTLLCFASVKHGQRFVLSVPRARISMNRICHGADMCFLHYMQRRPRQFSQPETASSAGDSRAPSWASTQTRVTLAELKCKLKSFWQNIHYCSALAAGISRE